MQILLLVAVLNLPGVLLIALLIRATSPGSRSRSRWSL